MTNTLVIDAASERYAVALGRDGEVVALIDGESHQDHSRLLLAAIDEVTGGDRSVIDQIIVTRGPGSYAGLRVGSATAQGLGLALGVAVTGIPTLELVAAASRRDGVTAIHPAGRGDFAVQAFKDGAPTGDMTIAGREHVEALAGPVAGEGTGALGGIEVSSADRAAAALRLARGATTESAEPIYLREPHITRPRRPYGDAARTR